MLSKVSDAIVTGYGIVMKTQTFTGSVSTYGAGAMTPNPLTIIGTDVYCRIRNTANSGNSSAYTGIRLTGKNYSGNSAMELSLRGNSTETARTHITKEYNQTIYMWLYSASNSYGSNGPTYLDYYDYDNISISKTIFTHKGLPRELKQIAQKATITIFGVHTDNERIEDFKGALSTNFEYVSSKGDKHRTTSVSTASYTAIGYGYCRYDVRSNGNEGYVKLNGVTLGYVNESGAHLINLIFFKPGDVLQFNLLYSLELVDYY